MLATASVGSARCYYDLKDILAMNQLMPMTILKRILVTTVPFLVHIDSEHEKWQSLAVIRGDMTY
jgi:hypothetical protein